MSKKKIKEVTLGNGDDGESMTMSQMTYDRNKSLAKNVVASGGEITIDNETNEAVVKEALKLPISDVLNSLGITLDAKTPEIQQGIKSFVRAMMGELQAKFGVGPILGESDEGDNKDKTGLVDRDLYNPDEEWHERDDNKFESVMKELADKNAPSVDIAESINPRIKKGDLIEYLKKSK
jgi:hypothetical protein